MIYLMTEIAVFLVGAFVLGWWFGRRLPSPADDAGKAERSPPEADG